MKLDSSTALGWVAAAAIGIYLLIGILFRVRVGNMTESAYNSSFWSRFIWVGLSIIFIIIIVAVILRAQGL